MLPVTEILACQHTHMQVSIPFTHFPLLPQNNTDTEEGGNDV